MPVYAYTAIDEKGKKKKGMVEAESYSAARRKLREIDVYLVKLEEAKIIKEKKLKRRLLLSFLERISPRDLALVTRQLSTLVGAGLPLVSSLNVLISQTKQGILHRLLVQIKDAINEGQSLTSSLSNFPHIFPPLYINMIRAGEASGNLDVVLERLADFLEGQETLKNKIRAALAYPILMFFIGSAVLFFLVSFVVPNITRIFQDMHQRLPISTSILIVVSDFLKLHWWIILTFLLVIFWGAKNFAKTNYGRLIWDKFKLRIPIFREIARGIIIARFSRTLGIMLKSDVPLLAALEIVRQVVNNSIFAEEIKRTIREVEEGQSLSFSLSKNNLFPPMVIEMIGVGEQSGNLEKMLFRIAQATEGEVEAKISIYTSLLEPIMILLMGMLVGFIVISILLPIFEMNQLIR